MSAIIYIINTYNIYMYIHTNKKFGKLNINPIIEFTSSKEVGGGLGLNIVAKREYSHIFKV